MSKAGNPQRRTTYLISLTLVKVEAVSEDVVGDQEKEFLPEWEGSPKKEEEEEEEAEEEEDVRNAPRKEEGSECEQVVEKELPALEEDVVPVRYDTAEETQGKPEQRKARGHQKELVSFGKGKDTSFMHQPVKQMVKVYGGTGLEGAVRREGPRSEVSRPKTELYREPPALYLRGENGADGNNRSRCSLPFSIPPQVNQRPEVLMRTNVGANSACWRELREANTSSYHSARTLDRRDNRLGDQSPLMAATTLGPYRASWADSDGRGTLIRPGVPLSGGYSGIMSRDAPQGDRFQTVSLPAPPSAANLTRPQRKTTNRTLDNSDLHSPSEDPKRTKEGQGGTIQRAPARDRKMLKFISGIFTKSTSAPPNVHAASPLYPALERGSSEEEGEFHLNARNSPAISHSCWIQEACGCSRVIRSRGKV